MPVVPTEYHLRGLDSASAPGQCFTLGRSRERSFAGLTEERLLSFLSKLPRGTLSSPCYGGPQNGSTGIPLGIYVASRMRMPRQSAPAS